jgi:hypothetical protein
MQLTFAGTAGQYLALYVSEAAGGISSAAITVLRPDGTTLTTGTLTTVPCNASCGYQVTGSTLVNMGPLPLSGTYTVLLQQTGSGSLGALAFTLSSPVTGTLSVGSTVNVSATLPGQPMQLSVGGVAGETLTLSISESSGAITSTTIRVLNPSGIIIASGTLDTTYCGVCGGYSGNVSINIGTLTVSGTYPIIIQQSSPGTGTLSFTL